MYTMTSIFFIVSYCHLSAILQTMSIIVETYKTIELRFEVLTQFKGFYLTLHRIWHILERTWHVVRAVTCCTRRDVLYARNVQCIPLVTETSERTGKNFPKYGAPCSILSGRKWRPLPAHVMMSSHFLHNDEVCFKFRCNILFSGKII